jgi:hypothetical protein
MRLLLNAIRYSLVMHAISLVAMWVAFGILAM